MSLASRQHAAWRFERERGLPPTRPDHPSMTMMNALDAINDPVFLVRTDGSIDHRNQAANAEFPSSFLLGERLSPVNPGVRKFARYLSFCAGSSRSCPGAIDLLRGHRVSRYRCRGSLVRDGGPGPSRILLHLSPGRGPRGGMPGRARGEPPSERRLEAQLRREVHDQEEICARIVRDRDEALFQLYQGHHDERLALARDLHDQIGQHIVNLKLSARAIGQHLPTEDGRRRLDGLERRLDEMARDLHDVALRLRPTALDDFGLGLAIRHMLDEWGVATGLLTDFAMTGADPDLPSAMELSLYYACKEALTNAVKHAAGASRLGVTLHYGGAAVTLTVEDDGPGLPSCRSDGISHRPLGLAGLRERLSLVGGEVHVESSPGEGVTVIARVPRQGKAGR